MTAVSRKPPEIKLHLEQDLGDAELKVEEFEDGMFAVWVDDHRALLSADQMREYIAGLRTVAAAKGWP